jgi:hypothetical protein
VKNGTLRSLLGVALHLVRRENWATIDLDVTNGHVFVRQEWCYAWGAPHGVPPWTAEEKAKYHHKIDRLIWAFWSMRAGIMVSRKEIRDGRVASRDPLKRFSHRRLTLSFDIKKVSKPTQWSVRVDKVDPKKDDPKLNPKGKGWPRPECLFPTRELQLYDMSVDPHRANRLPTAADVARAEATGIKWRDPLRQEGFYAAPHEFGHALGYSNLYGKRDEYEPESESYEDVESIMNIGRRLRDRHFFLLMDTLGRMVPACTFSARVEP